MNIVDLVFLAIFLCGLITMIVSGLISFYFNYAKFLQLKSYINSKELDVSQDLKDTLYNPLWIYKLFSNQSLISEVNSKVDTNKKLSGIDKRYKSYLKFQIIGLVIILVSFLLYVLIKIMTS